jgi:hypothetical protein
MPNAQRTIEVTAGQLAAAGVRYHPCDGPLRILVRHEIDEETGQNATGVYVEGMDRCQWRGLTDGVVDTMEQAVVQTRALSELAALLDPGLAAWLAEFCARDGD